MQTNTIYIDYTKRFIIFKTEKHYNEVKEIIITTLGPNYRLYYDFYVIIIINRISVKLTYKLVDLIHPELDGFTHPRLEVCFET